MKNGFFRGHGLGNDYLVMDPKELTFKLTPAVIRTICDRNWGLGSDGILALVPVSTPAGEDRPRTYQLWLTEKALWQVRTTGDKAQSEPLARPENANVEHLDRLVREKLGSTARKSMMTVSEVDIQKLRSTGTSWRDDSLNGKLSISVDGIVFLIPNPY